MKEIVIPITSYKFGVYLTYTITIISWSLLVTCIALGFPKGYNWEIIFPLSLLGGIIGGVFSLSFLVEEGFDLNPFHKIGYCIRFMRRGETIDK